LKPLDRDDEKSKVKVQWNPMINTTTTTTTTTSHSSIATLKKPKLNKEDNENIMKKSPETSEEFVQFWIRIADYSERFTYIWNLR